MVFPCFKHNEPGSFYYRHMIEKFEEAYDTDDHSEFPSVVKEFVEALVEGSNKLIVVQIGAIIGAVEMLPLAVSTLYRRFSQSSSSSGGPVAPPKRPAAVSI